MMNTQKVEETPKVGHRGGGEHRCWRCALKKAIAVGFTSALSTFAREYRADQEYTDIFKKSFTHVCSKEALVKMADMVHRVTIELDEMSGRSTEVN